MVRPMRWRALARRIAVESPRGQQATSCICAGRRDVMRPGPMAHGGVMRGTTAREEGGSRCHSLESVMRA